MASASRPTSVSLTPEPGRRVGLLLQGSAETGWTSNSCLQLSPAQLRAAAADPDAGACSPGSGSVRFRLPGCVDVALGGLRVSVAARPALACGSFVEGVVAAPIVVHT